MTPKTQFIRACMHICTTGMYMRLHATSEPVVVSLAWVVVIRGLRGYPHSTLL